MKYLIRVVILLCIAVSCSEPKDTIYPEEKSITQSVYASGVVVSANQYQAFAASSGILDRLFVLEGDTVVVGQAIAQISNAQASLGRDNAALAADFADVRNNSERLEELRVASLAAAVKRSDDSTMALRQRTLLKQGVGSQVEAEQRDLAAASSKASHINALLRYTQLQKQLRFASKQAEVAREISRSASNDLIVRSRVTGKVFAILKKQGESVSPQTPLAIVGSSDSFIIELQVDEFDIASIRVGQVAYVTMDSYRGSVFRAVVTKVYPMMNARSKSFTVEARFESQPEKLYANLTVEANIIIQTKKKVLIIPRSYVTKDGFVKRKDGTLQQIQQGVRDFQMVEILGGLTKTDAIVKP